MTDEFQRSILHIGLPGTGTGTLQRWFFPKLAERNGIKYFGKVYDDFHKEGYHYFNQPKYKTKEKNKIKISLLPYISGISFDQSIQHLEFSENNIDYNDFNAEFLHGKWIFSSESFTHPFCDLAGLVKLLCKIKEKTNCRLLVSIRDPLELVWSRYWYAVRRERMTDVKIDFLTYFDHHRSNKNLENRFNFYNLILGGNVYREIENKLELEFFDSFEVLNNNATNEKFIKSLCFKNCLTKIYEKTK